MPSGRYGASFRDDVDPTLFSSSVPPVSGTESYLGTHIALRTIEGDLIVTGTITADKLSVSQLSAITADMGTLTAGVIRDPASKTIFDLAARKLSFIDEQGSPVTRVEIGELGGLSTDWGIRIRSSSGAVLWDLTGLGVDTVGTTQLVNGNVTTLKIADLNITTSKLANDAVQSTKLAQEMLDGIMHVDARNRIWNSGFESGTTFWDNAGIGTMTVPTNAANAKTGNRYLELTHNAALDGHHVDEALSSRYFEVRPGDVVTFGGWANRQSGDGQALYNLVTVDKDKATVSGNSTTGITSSSYTLTEATITIGATVKYVRFKAAITAATVSTVCRFDDCYVKIQTPGGDLVDGTITTIKVGDSQITTTKINDLAITTIKINDSAVTTLKLNDLAVTSAKIGDSQVTTNKINNSAVTLLKIGDFEISSDKLRSQGDNLLENPGFELGAIGWFTSAGIGTIVNDAGNAHTGNWCYKYDNNGSGGPNLLSGSSGSATIKVETGDQFFVSCWVKGVGSAGTTQLAVRWRDATQTQIQRDVIAQVTGPQASYTQLSGFATAPANAVYAILDIGENTADNTATPWYFDDVVMLRAITTGLIVASAVVTDKIAANAVTAAKIAVHTITANEIAALTITAAEIAAGTITAGKLNVSTLSSITADVGTLTAGKIQNVGGTAGILLSGSLPGGWTTYLDLTAGGASPLLHHSKIDLNADGTATFKGLLDITNAPLSVGFGGAFIVFRDSDVAHGMTSQVDTNVLGIITAADDLQGGWNVVGWAESTATAASFQGYNVTASTSNPIVRFDGGKKSGTTVAAAAATDLMYSFANFGTTFLQMFGDGSVTIGTRVASGLTVSNLGPSTRTPLTVTQGSLESGGLPAINITSTWNTAGTPTLIKSDITDTSSPSGSLLIDLQVGASSKFSIRKDGRTVIGVVDSDTGAILQIKKTMSLQDAITSGNPNIFWDWKNSSGTARSGYLEATADSVRFYSSTLADSIISMDYATGKVTIGASSDIAFSKAAARIQGGATSLALRNNANSNDNLLIADNGDVTVRNTLRLNNSLYDNANNLVLLQSVAATGWGNPTGTATRTAFATGTVTLIVLAEHVKALIDDLKSFHGIIKA